jgi:hypothetical protein
MDRQLPQRRRGAGDIAERGLGSLVQMQTDMDEAEKTIAIFKTKTETASNEELIAAVNLLLGSFDGLFEFPKRAVLLWDGCIRMDEEYRFPQGFLSKWKQGIKASPDRRMRNGPPNAAFRLAGGRKPSAWELDHIYDEQPLWSVRKPRHFTQSAGLVAMPRHAHQARHRKVALTWMLRGVAYRRFGYDPLTVFSGEPHDEYGFLLDRPCEVFWSEPME